LSNVYVAKTTTKEQSTPVYYIPGQQIRVYYTLQHQRDFLNINFQFQEEISGSLQLNSDPYT